MYRIFVIEDDEAINRLLCMNLSIAGYEPVPAKDGKEALERIQNGERFDLALLDVMLPGIDGFQLMEPLKAHGIPVIYLTAKNDLQSKLTGLTSGAEDYIVKPFEVMELLVRMEKVLARHGSAGTITFSDLTIHVDERTVIKGNEPIILKPLEFDLLLFFIRNRNIALTRERILTEVWGMNFYGERRTIDIHVSQLRKKPVLPSFPFRVSGIVWRQINENSGSLSPAFCPLFHIEPFAVRNAAAAFKHQKHSAIIRKQRAFGNEYAENLVFLRRAEKHGRRTDGRRAAQSDGLCI